MKLKNAILIGLLTASTTANAGFIKDTFIGDWESTNSSDLSERQALADLLGIPVEDVELIDKETTPVVDIGPFANPGVDGQWYLDVDPSKPGYFAVKFGTGGTGIVEDTYFFENIEELTKLVWANTDVNGLSGSPDCNNCTIDRLSHYSTFDSTVSVSTPASLALIGLGLIGVAGIKSRKS